MTKPEGRKSPDTVPLSRLATGIPYANFVSEFLKSVLNYNKPL
jgi:hypothetical protein